MNKNRHIILNVDKSNQHFVSNGDIIRIKGKKIVGEELNFNGFDLEKNKISILGKVLKIEKLKHIIIKHRRRKNSRTKYGPKSIFSKVQITF